MKTLYIFIALMFFVSASGQHSTDINKYHFINVIQSKKLDRLVKRYRKKHQLKGKVKAYRIQVYNGDRLQANKLKLKVVNIFPELYSEVIFSSLEFKTVIGVYRTRLEATKVLKDIKPIFRNAFIVRMIVDLNYFKI